MALLIDDESATSSHRTSFSSPSSSSSVTDVSSTEDCVDTKLKQSPRAGRQLTTVSTPKTKCILCLASFESSEQLRAHIQIVHASLACDKQAQAQAAGVNETSMNAIGRSRHYGRNVAPERTLPVAITRQKIVANSPRRKRQTTGVTGSHQCLECNKRFQQLGHLRNHLRLHTGERPFVCEICGKGFPQSGHLVSHINSHTDTRLYECSFCKKRFTQSGHLRNHEYLHLGIRPYQCTQCDKSFTQSGHLVNHLRLHDGDKPYSCETCGRRFTQSGHLTSHERLHNNDNGNNSNKPNNNISHGHQCRTCKKSFTRAEHLSEHCRVHSDPRPAVCLHPGCGVRLSSDALLAVHERLHRPESPLARRRNRGRRAATTTKTTPTTTKSVVVTLATRTTRTTTALTTASNKSGHPVIVRLSPVATTSQPQMAHVGDVKVE